jgi:hypothetical protein
MHTKCCLENRKGRYHSEDLGIDGRIILLIDLKETGFVWLRIRIDKSRSVVSTVMNVRFHKKRGIS